VDGVHRKGNTDYYDVVESRIRDLESRLYQAETFLKEAEPEKIALADNLARVKAELAGKAAILKQMEGILKRVDGEVQNLT
jgi:hypothetical protein